MTDWPNEPPGWHEPSGEDEFTPWTGGECPVNPSAIVECVFGDGSRGELPASEWTWNSSHSPIIGYRVVSDDRKGLH